MSVFVLLPRRSKPISAVLIAVLLSLSFTIFTFLVFRDSVTAHIVDLAIDGTFEAELKGKVFITHRFIPSIGPIEVWGNLEASVKGTWGGTLQQGTFDGGLTGAVTDLNIPVEGAIKGTYSTTYSEQTGIAEGSLKWEISTPLWGTLTISAPMKFRADPKQDRMEGTFQGDWSQGDPPGQGSVKGTYLAEALGPDLVATSLTYNPSTPREVDNIEIGAKIENRWNRPADTVEVRFNIYDTGGRVSMTREHSIGKLGAGQSAQATITTKLKRGNYVVELVSDPRNIVHENKEENNVLKTSMTVKPYYTGIKGTASCLNDPVAQATVTIAGPSPLTVVVWQGTTDGSGKYDTDLILDPAEYSIMLSHARIEWPRATGTVPEGEYMTVDFSDCTLLGGLFDLRIQVTGSAGQGLAFATVLVKGPTVPGGSAARTSDQGGFVELPGLAPGEYDVEVSYQGFTGSAKVTDADLRAGKSVTVVLPPYTEVLGIVLTFQTFIAGIAIALVLLLASITLAIARIRRKKTPITIQHTTRAYRELAPLEITILRKISEGKSNMEELSNLTGVDQSIISRKIATL